MKHNDGSPSPHPYIEAEETETQRGEGRGSLEFVPKWEGTVLKADGQAGSGEKEGAASFMAGEPPWEAASYRVALRRSPNLLGPQLCFLQFLISKNAYFTPSI